MLSVLTVWLPCIAYLAAPEATTAPCGTPTGGSAHSRTLVTAALAVAGVALVVNGALGLSGTDGRAAPAGQPGPAGRRDLRHAGVA